MAEPLFVSPKLEVRRSSLHGRGVFATAPFAAGELIEECHFAIVDSTPAAVDRSLNAYLFTWPRGSTTTLAMVLGFGMVYNHSDTPNITWDTDVAEEVYRFRALRAIAAGEELCHWYGAHATREIARRNARRARGLAGEVLRFLAQPRSLDDLSRHFPDTDPELLACALALWSRRGWVAQDPMGRYLAGPGALG